MGYARRADHGVPRRRQPHRARRRARPARPRARHRGRGCRRGLRRARRRRHRGAPPGGRHRHPGTGVVVLSQYDEPEYAISLLSEGAAGYAYLLKDRVAEGDQLARAVREVATGGSMLDPAVVSALINPVRGSNELSPHDDNLLSMVAAGKPIKAIAAS